jgi:secreted trypsin-like serine protease
MRCTATGTSRHARAKAGAPSAGVSPKRSKRANAASREATRGVAEGVHVKTTDKSTTEITVNAVKIFTCSQKNEKGGTLISSSAPTRVGRRTCKKKARSAACRDSGGPLVPRLKFVSGVLQQWRSRRVLIPLFKMRE